MTFVRVLLISLIIAFAPAAHAACFGPNCPEQPGNYVFRGDTYGNQPYVIIITPDTPDRGGVSQGFFMHETQPGAGAIARCTREDAAAAASGQHNLDRSCN